MAESSAWVYGCFGLAVNRLPGADLDDLAEIHHRHAVRHVEDHVEIVRDEEVGEAEARREIHQEVQHLGLDRDVEGRDRLVGHDEARLERQRGAIPMRWRWPPDSSCG
jgi:hypothetical protein